MPKIFPAHYFCKISLCKIDSIIYLHMAGSWLQWIASSALDLMTVFLKLYLSFLVLNLLFV